MDDVTVVVATFGNQEWAELANERAIPSARAEGVWVAHVHGDTLHEARNTGLDQVDTSFVVFLDADDELAPGYLTAMAAGTADVRAPAVRYISPTAISPPHVPKVPSHEHECVGACLLAGNWVVVGAMVKTDLVRRVGGWQDWPIYEDWDLFLRLYQAGASFEAIPSAVYRAYVRADSRNRSPDRATRLEGHRMIARANGVPVP